jgi:hypothetical protein
MRKLFVIGTTVAVFALLGGGTALAASPPGPGQPSQTCLTKATGFTEPGGSATAPGSAFNETGPGVAGTVYAGNGVSATKAGSPKAISQYDVACYQLSH